MREFQGFPVRTFGNEYFEMDVLLKAGPRVVRFIPKGKMNLFADVKNEVTSPFGVFYYRGGHRLWHAPEAFPRTYIPDDSAIDIFETDEGIQLIGKVEKGTGIQKSIELKISKDKPEIRLLHTLRNNNLWQVEIAPWTLTMFRLGGMAILPQPNSSRDPDGLQNNRNLALWPYTHIDDERLILRDDFLLIHGYPSDNALKVGYHNPAGWSAYFLDDCLFRKSYGVTNGAPYPDNGCNTESYCCNQFIELEALGPLVKLNPGDIVKFQEKWDIYSGLDLPFLTEQIREVIKRFY